MSRKTHSRRQFMGELSSTILQMAMMSYSLQAGLCAKKTFAAGAKKRRHLINVSGMGGWDSPWFHQGFTSHDLVNLPAATQALFNTYTVRYQDKDTWAHPVTGATLGQGMKLLMDNSDLNNMLLWLGMQQEGQHKIGNQVLMHGLLANYAASFSSVVALRLSQELDYVRDLHYVQVSNAPSDLLLQSGFLSGYALPVNIGNMAAWTALTASGGGVVNALESSKQSTINALGMLAGAKAGMLSQSRAAFNGYNAAHSSLLRVSNSNWASSQQFTDTLNRYRNAIQTALSTMFNNVKVPARNLAKTPITPQAQPLSTQTLDPYFGGIGVAGVARYMPYFESTVFSYALAEYLIRNDLSAVVDLATPTPDAHDKNADAIVYCTVTFACFQELTRALKGHALTDGTNVLDHTTVILQSEFDRELKLSTSTGDVNDWPGSSHGSSSSVIMAGYGINVGTTIGGIKTGRAEHLVYPSVAPFYPLPVDANGQPSASSNQFTSTKQIFPTICKIFGASIPPNQQTEYVAHSPAIKPSKID